MKAVLLVIDVLNDFVGQHVPERQTALIAAINNIADLVRGAKGEVIWVRQEFAPDLHDAFLVMRRTGRPVTIAGTPGAQLAEGLDVRPEERVVVKKRYSAFFGTGLDAMLPPSGKCTLIICGLNTHACVRMAAIDAYQRDHDVVIATDATMSYDADQHEDSLRYLGRAIARLKDNAAVAAMLADTPDAGGVDTIG